MTIVASLFRTILKKVRELERHYSNPQQVIQSIFGLSIQIHSFPAPFGMTATSIVRSYFRFCIAKYARAPLCQDAEQRRSELMSDLDKAFWVVRQLPHALPCASDDAKYLRQRTVVQFGENEPNSRHPRTVAPKAKGANSKTDACATAKGTQAATDGPKVEGAKKSKKNRLCDKSAHRKEEEESKEAQRVSPHAFRFQVGFANATRRPIVPFAPPLHPARALVAAQSHEGKQVSVHIRFRPLRITQKPRGQAPFFK